MALTTPVAFFVFNRPEPTARVFEAIRLARPARLLIVADGPRQQRSDDIQNTGAVRRIIDAVDWPCDVQLSLSDQNMGCRARLATGLDWVFAQADEAIILEDDCLPHPSFFRFCVEVLDRYRADERVMHIGGANFQDGNLRSPDGYYFSKYPHVWGWATWRRAWRHYDVDMKTWPQWRSTPSIDSICPGRVERTQRLATFEAAHEKRIDTWDYQWVFACWARNALSIIPSVNLVSNIGFGAAATHTRAAESVFANRATFEWSNGTHPSSVVPNTKADEYFFRTYEQPSLASRAINLIANRLRRSVTP